MSLKKEVDVRASRKYSSVSPGMCDKLEEQYGVILRYHCAHCGPWLRTLR